MNGPMPIKIGTAFEGKEYMANFGQTRTMRNKLRTGGPSEKQSVNSITDGPIEKMLTSQSETVIFGSKLSFNLSSFTKKICTSANEIQ